MKKTILKVIRLIIIVVLVLLLFNFYTIKRLYHSIHIFDEDVIIHNFQHMDEAYPVTYIAPGANPFHFPKRLDYQLLDSFTFKEKTYNVEEYFKNTLTEGFLIIHKDTIVFEQYYNGLTDSTTHISWSMAKSVVSTLLGMAHDEGLFDLEKPITDYIPQMKDTGYDGVRIKDILQMSSGVGFNEDYGDFNSDINRFGRAFAMGSSLEDFCKTLKRERKPGTYCHYVSIDTQVLGMLLANVTGKSLSDNLKEKIWDPMGMEYPAEWIIDNTGFEVALGGLNITLRDYAKLGQLYLHKGQFNNIQLVSQYWIKAATTPDANHLMPGEHDLSSHPYGYGFQWWIPQDDYGAFFAVGIYNQFIYVQPKKDLVIVKLSANHHFKQEGSITKDIHMAMFKAMAEGFDTKN
jgi:CubicO group peptidase (beta-lactamase class C family)